MYGSPGHAATTPSRPVRDFVAALGGRAPTVDQMVDVRLLLAVDADLRRHGGEAAGRDRIGLHDAGAKEMAGLLRALRNAVLSGTWRPDPVREVRVPKANGGHRVIGVPGRADRVLFAAATALLTPVVDPQLSDQSHGFRPGRSHLSALAELAVAVERTGAVVLTQDDVATAFDAVPVDAAVAALTTLVPNSPELLAVVDRAAGPRPQEEHRHRAGERVQPHRAQRTAS